MYYTQLYRVSVCVCAAVFLGGGAAVFAWDRLANHNESNSDDLSFTRPDDQNRKGSGIEPVQLRHEFGVVSPRTRNAHEFVIHNNSDQPWTVRSVEAGCACTVTKLSEKRVNPDRELKVEVTYSAVGEDGDVLKRVHLRFNEALAPLVVLEVAAQVRSPLSVSAISLEFRGVGRGSEPEQSLEVRNFSGQDWKRLTAMPDQDWLIVACKEREKRDLIATAPRQVWDISVKINTRSLHSGRHEGCVRLEANTADVTGKSLPVTVNLTAPVMAMPDQLFFGNVEKHTPSESRVLLRFTKDSFPPDKAGLILTHDLGPSMTLTCEHGPANCWIIVATVRPEDAAPNGEVIEGRIRVRFREESLPDLIIPVCAKVGQE